MARRVQDEHACSTQRSLLLGDALNPCACAFSTNIATCTECLDSKERKERVQIPTSPLHPGVQGGGVWGQPSAPTWMTSPEPCLNSIGCSTAGMSRACCQIWPGMAPRKRALLTRYPGNTNAAVHEREERRMRGEKHMRGCRRSRAIRTGQAAAARPNLRTWAHARLHLCYASATLQ